MIFVTNPCFLVFVGIIEAQIQYSSRKQANTEDSSLRTRLHQFKPDELLHCYCVAAGFSTVSCVTAARVVKLIKVFSYFSER